MLCAPSTWGGGSKAIFMEGSRGGAWPMDVCVCDDNACVFVGNLILGCVPEF